MLIMFEAIIVTTITIAATITINVIIATATRFAARFEEETFRLRAFEIRDSTLVQPELHRVKPFVLKALLVPRLRDESFVGLVDLDSNLRVLVVFNVRLLLIEGQVNLAVVEDLRLLRLGAARRGR